MTKQKKLMLLGGLRYLIPVIEEAHKLGIYVITCDYLPDNIAHKYSDEYCNVSIIDKEAVLKVAIERQIDGIMSFAVDPGVVSAAYVQEKMGLPAFGPYKSVEILQNKDKFRKFLSDNNFVVPKAKGYSSIEEALSDIHTWDYPIIVKPTDSAGSKGVTRVSKKEEFKAAVEHAFEFSLSGHIIIEDFVEKEGCSSDSDCFSVNGKLVFTSFSAQRFDKNADNPYTPSAYSWPSTMTSSQEEELTNEIQRLLTLLKMNTSVYNIETRVGTNGKCYIMEVSPRGGGNRISEIIKMSKGVDLIKNSVLAAVGENPETNFEVKPYDGHWALVVLHAERSGIFKSLDLESDFERKYLIQNNLWVESGDEVNAFMGANDSLGTLVLKFDTEENLKNFMDNQSMYYKINLD